MKSTHPASAAPADYSRETVEILASASSKIRAAAHVAKANGLEFTLDAGGDVENPGKVTLTIPDPTRPHNCLRIIMTRKTASARPAHQVDVVGRYTVTPLQVAMIQSRLRTFIANRAKFNEALAADAAVVAGE